MSSWGAITWAAIRSAWFSALGGQLPRGAERESEGGSGDHEDELDGKTSLEETTLGPRVVDCPQPGCGHPAFIVDQGVVLPGVGYCGHEWLFKMIKVMCTEGHRLDALDETGSIHTPDIECKGVVNG